MRKLLIVSGSKRVSKEPTTPIRAMDRIKGVHVNLAKKYYKKTGNFDITILSPVYGLVRANERIGFKEPISGEWDKVSLDQDTISQKREENIQKLRKILSKKTYDEIYVNVGKSMFKLIEGFERVVPSSITITFSKGNGLGPKMADMKNWLKLNRYAKK